MDRISRKKSLGQFFSGHHVAELLYSLLKHDGIATMIDPMCGEGDMFFPFKRDNITTYGNEIDVYAYKKCKQCYPTTDIWNFNCFSTDAIKNYCKWGYDVVMTNPPYIRYQLQNEASEIVNGKWLLLEQIKIQLLMLADSMKTINSDERELVKKEINNISGLADLAVPSWILCLLLVKPGGQLALVLPSAWLSREYSSPVKNILIQLFKVQFVVNDANASWFKGKAQVKTSIIIATRGTNNEPYEEFSLIDLYKNAGDSRSLTGNLGYNNLIDKFEEPHVRQGLITVRRIPIGSFLATNQSGRNSVGWSSLLSKVADSRKLVQIGNCGIKFGQGLRTGANSFFYVPEVLVKGKQSNYFFPDVIQNQKQLKDTFSTAIGTCKLVYIQDAVTPEDYQYIPDRFKKSIHILPKEICEFIKTKSVEKKGDTIIPELSSVKTNIARGNEEKPPRFWYMIPPLTRRHFGDLFLPRVNGARPFVRLNPKKLVVDANFLTIWIEGDSTYNLFSLLAVLNSTWCSVQFEELGSVLGGGALKLDAIQIKKILVPVFHQNHLDELTEIGKRLRRCGFSNKGIIDEIDRIILETLEIPDIKDSVKELNLFRDYYYNQRNNGSK